MKNIKNIFLVTAIGIMTLGGTSAFAQGLPVTTSTSATVNSNSPTAGAGVKAKVDINQYKNERDELLNVDAGVKAKIAEFKNNLAAVKKAPLSEKKAFVVNTYQTADQYFSNEYNQFVNYLNKLESQGVNVSEARSHFAIANNDLVTARASAQAIAQMDLSKVTASEVKAKAKEAEAGYKEVRRELHEGAKALKVAIKARISAQVGRSTSATSTGTVNQ